VTKTVVESLPADSGQDHLPVVIAAMPISARERRIAFSVIGMLAAIDAIVAPFANVPLTRVDAFIPVVQTVMCVIDLLTAALLFAQYSIQPVRPLLAVASGYVFSGLFAFIQTLAFPGAYSATGLIGDGNSAPWIFVLWHITFPLALIIYVLSKDRGDAVKLSSGSIAANIAGTIAFVLVATATLTWLAVDGT
jgi:Membrane-associated sensor, integral membrane domain